MIRIIIEYDKDDERTMANIFGRFLLSCTQIDGTGWTEFKEYLKELFIRKTADYSPVEIITKDAQDTSMPKG
jgi:hypothetical protein